MKSSWCRSVLLLVFSSIVLLPAVPASQASEREAQLVRLGYVHGDVRCNRGDGKYPDLKKPWEQAAVNLPIEQGFALATGSGWAEVEFESGGSVYLAENSVILFQQLTVTDGVPAADLELISGAATAAVEPLPKERFVIEMSVGQFQVAYPESSFVRIDTYLDGISFTPQGDAGSDFFPNGRSKLHVEKGRTLTYESGQPLRLEGAVQVKAPNNWDQWVQARTEAQSTDMQAALKASGLSSPIPGLTEMYASGTFLQCAPYGMCWEPPQETVGLAQTSPRAPAVQAGQSAGVQFSPPAVAYNSLPVQCPLPSQGGPWAWTGYNYASWICRDNHYLVIVKKEKHHRHMHWVKVGKRTGFVPTHPADQKGKPPINLKHGIFLVSADRAGERIEHASFESKEELKILSNPPTEFRDGSYPQLAKAERPQIQARLVGDAASTVKSTDVSGSDRRIMYDYGRSEFVRSAVVLAGHSTGVSPSRGQSVDTTPQSETKTVQAPAPTLKVATQLVQVSVVVQDKHGKPITGLKKSDFTVLDNKQRQEIQFFSGEENSAEGQARSQPPLPPNAFTNKVLSTSAGLNNVTVILLDALNTPLLDQSYARDQVIKFLQQIKPEDHIAIYTLGRHLRMMHDFTTDSASLVEIMQKYKGRPTTELEASKEWNDSPLQTFLLPREAEASADTAFGDRVRITAEAFQDIANHLAWAPGRKNLIWVSGAFPLVIGLAPGRLDAPISFTDEIGQVTKVLNNANLAVYPVDARGIVGEDLTGKGTGMRFEGPAGHGDWPSLLTMSAIAAMTGGKAYFNNDDIKGCIQEAMNDASVTYKLAYAPQGITWNGRYRRIKVEVGVPGAKVRAREGYFATPLPNANERVRSAILGGTAMSPLEATAIELTTRVMATDVSTRKIAVVTLMDLHQIFFKSEDGKRIAKIDAALAQVDDRNAIVGVESQSMSLELAPEVYQRLLAQGGTYSKEVTVDPKAVSLRIVIRDAATGNIGSVNIPLEKYFPKTNRGS
jgi:VWFA-related protein